MDVSETDQIGTPGGDGAHAPLRVILVGRTGIDGQLRGDSDLELVRVRSRLDAIGELAGAFAERLRPVVVVGAPAQGEIDPVPGAFADALRRVDPRVRIIASGADAADAGACDAVVRPGAAHETLRRTLRGDQDRAPEPPATAPARAPAPAPQDESAALEALMRGQDPVPALLALMEHRLGGRAVQLLPPEQAAPGDAPVVHGGRTLGHLRAAGCAPAEVARQAEWLARWIALRDQHAQLREAAFIDPLTGAYNRRYFDRFLAAALERARGDRRTVTVMVFDVDDLKTFNDQHGHAAGDDILKEAVRLLRSVIRPSDKVCRIGGDEFAVVFDDPAGPRTATSRPPTDVFQIAGRFQRAVREARFPKLGSQAPGTLTISGGLATFPWDGHTPQELLRRADDLALQSKREGKNAIRFGPGSERV